MNNKLDYVFASHCVFCVFLFFSLSVSFAFYSFYVNLLRYLIDFKWQLLVTIVLVVLLIDILLVYFYLLHELIK